MSPEGLDVQDRPTVQAWAARIHALMEVDLGQAHRAAKQATAMHPGVAALLALRAEIQVSRGHIQSAAKLLEAAQDCTPMDMKTRIRLIWVAIAVGRFTQARGLVRDGLQDDRGRELLFSLAEALIDMGDHGLAIEVLDDALAKGGDPDLEKLMGLAQAGAARDQADGVGSKGKRVWLKAMQRLVVGEPARAEAEFVAVATAWPGYAPAWVGIRGALQAQGRVDAAQSVRADWMATAAGSTAAMEAGVRRKLSPRGLLFDPREPLKFEPKAKVLRRVESAEDLTAADNAYLTLDPGGQVFDHAPAFSYDDQLAQTIHVTSRAPETFLASIRNAMLVGRGAVVTEDGGLVDELTPPNPEKYEASRDAQGMRFDPAAFKDGLCSVRYFDTPAFLLTGPTDHSFGDWIINFPPKLMLAEAARLDCPVVIVSDHLPQTVDMLAALGVARERLIFHDGYGVSVFPKLYAPSWPMMERLQHIPDPFAVYRRAVLPAPAGPGPRLYLSRESIGKRRLVNEPEMRALFERRGFQVVHPERLDFQQMRQIFANPSCVAGPYGSALLNLVFSSRKASCLFAAPPTPELFLREAVTWLGALDLTFGYVRGQVVEGYSGPDHRAPWSVRLDLMEEALDRLLGLAET